MTYKDAIDPQSAYWQQKSQGDTIYPYPSAPEFNSQSAVWGRHYDRKTELERERRMQSWAPYLGGFLEFGRQLVPSNPEITKAPTVALENYIRASGQDPRFPDRPSVDRMNFRSAGSAAVDSLVNPGLASWVPSRAEGTSSMNTAKGVARGGILSIPWLATFNASAPYYMQRLGEIKYYAPEKYENYDGFLNKWQASKELAEDGPAKTLYGWANTGYGLANKVLDSTGVLKYDDWYRNAANGIGPAAAEGAGFTLFSLYHPGLFKGMYNAMSKIPGGRYLQKASPYVTKYNPLLLPDSIPATISTAASPIVKRIPVVGKAAAKGLDAFSKGWWGIRPFFSLGYKYKRDYDRFKLEKQREQMEQQRRQKLIDGAPSIFTAPEYNTPASLQQPQNIDPA